MNDKHILPEEGSITCEALLVAETTTEKVIHYSWVSILVLFEISFAWLAYKKSGWLGLAFELLFTFLFIYATTLFMREKGKTNGSFDRITRYDLTHTIVERIKH